MESMLNETTPVAIIGAGFAGLSAAYYLGKRGLKVVLIERDSQVGGLAGSFLTSGDAVLEKFYHHWFTNDAYILELVKDLGTEDKIVTRPSQTSLYYNNTQYRLSTPLDVLRFTPLNIVDRFRLGFLVIQARLIKDWRKIEHLSVEEWLVKLCGPRVYKLVWEPLIRAKFSLYADQLSATWFWKKLQLRGSSRGKTGGEELAYYAGGFGALADTLVEKIKEQGGEILLETEVLGIEASEGQVQSVVTNDRIIEVSGVIATPALPIIADVLGDSVQPDYAAGLRKINYLANKCLVLELSESLSDTYWLNVNDPSFPFVGVIEHTNFEPASSYAGRHIVYMSRYLHHEDPVYAMSSEELLEYALPYIRKMFPKFEDQWIVDAQAWSARYAQPVTERNYSKMMVPTHTPLRNLWICTMAQIYPEDRGTNYAIREGRATAELVAKELRASDRLIGATV